MKRIVGLILVFCLVFSLFAEALAVPKWEIVEQTKCETNEKKKTVSLSVKVKGKGIKYQWVFVNPEDPEDKVTGKNLSKDKRFKGIKVKDYAKSKIILSKVPEALHGWYAYCHLYANAYKLDTNPVTVQLPGMTPAPEPDISKFTLEDTLTPALEKEKEDAELKEAKKKWTEEETYEYVMKRAEGDLYEPELKEITVSANGKYLYKLDIMGNPESEEAASSVTLIDSGNVAVKTDTPLKSFSINGVRIEPEEELTSFKLYNINTDTALSLKTASKGAVASEKVDDSVTYTITCTGCSFTYMPKGLKSVTEGEVPSGAMIYVFADKSDAGTGTVGYTINGSEPQYLGASSIQLTVTEDLEIAAEETQQKKK